MVHIDPCHVLSVVLLTLNVYIIMNKIMCRTKSQGEAFSKYKAQDEIITKLALHIGNVPYS
jgi:hypothetical protein